MANLYLVYRVHDIDKYDQYIDFVCAAKDPETAKQMHPETGKKMTKQNWKTGLGGAWVNSPDDLDVTPLSDFKNGDIITTNFNAG